MFKIPRTREQFSSTADTPRFRGLDAQGASNLNNFESMYVQFLRDLFSRPFLLSNGFIFFFFFFFQFYSPDRFILSLLLQSSSFACFAVFFSFSLPLFLAIFIERSTSGIRSSWFTFYKYIFSRYMQISPDVGADRVAGTRGLTR